MLPWEHPGTWGQGSPVPSLLSCVNHGVGILEGFLQRGAFELGHEVQSLLEDAGSEFRGHRPGYGAGSVGPDSLCDWRWGKVSPALSRGGSVLQERGGHAVFEEQSKAV